MKNLAILQARTSSTRLPGKVLLDLMGEPMILRQIERIKNSKQTDLLVVATSTDSSDDLLTETLIANGVIVRRGSLDNVLDRFVAIVKEFNPQNVIRLTADCPLTDSKLIDEVILSHAVSNADYSSNSLELTYPDGLDVECFKTSTLLSLEEKSLSSMETEHVTYGIYTRPESYTLNPVTQCVDHSSLRWTVDVAEDLDFVRWVYSNLYEQNHNFSYADILELIENNPEHNRTDSLVKRNSGMHK